ncbi:unnamed protein product [Mytilus edulis]|uniref:Uncharacterized protein n=1 Tax=Mytilus edulis TaxID=6550 RepID=A0A8S3TDM8_MYTED|nr:unnamed protein product [Mytilus edulis]
MIFTILLCCMVGQNFAATTMNPSTKHHAHHHTGTHPTHAHRTHPTVEHPVKESFAFRYDPNMHLMLASQRHKCFIYTMNGQESTEVHTPHGLHELENFAATTMNPSTKHHAHHHTGTHPTHAHRTHPTVEHPVKESFAFRYDPNMHLMLASQRHKCFIYTMNGQESTEVHTPHGLHELEHLMLASQRHKCFIYTMNGQESTEVHTPHGLHELEKSIITIIDDTSRTFSTMSHDAVMAASKTFAHQCNKNGTTTFKLN